MGHNRAQEKETGKHINRRHPDQSTERKKNNQDQQEHKKHVETHTMYKLCIKLKFQKKERARIAITSKINKYIHMHHYTCMSQT